MSSRNNNWKVLAFIVVFSGWLYYMKAYADPKTSPLEATETSSRRRGALHREVNDPDPDPDPEWTASMEELRKHQLSILAQREMAQEQLKEMIKMKDDMGMRYVPTPVQETAAERHEVIQQTFMDAILDHRVSHVVGSSYPSPH